MIDLTIEAALKRQVSPEPLVERAAKRGPERPCRGRKRVGRTSCTSPR